MKRREGMILRRPAKNVCNKLAKWRPAKDMKIVWSSISVRSSRFLSLAHLAEIFNFALRIWCRVSCTTCTSVYFCISGSGQPEHQMEFRVHCGCPRGNFNAIFMRPFFGFRSFISFSHPPTHHHWFHFPSLCHLLFIVCHNSSYFFLQLQFVARFGCRCRWEMCGRYWFLYPRGRMSGMYGCCYVCAAVFGFNWVRLADWTTIFTPFGV